MNQVATRPRAASPAGKQKPARRPERPKGIELAEERWDFWKDAAEDFKKLCFILAGALMVAIPLIPAAYAAGCWVTAKGSTIGINQKGVAVRIPEISDPELSDAAIRRFCGDAVSEVGTYAYDDFDLRYPKWQGYFTDNGWRLYNQALVKREVKDSITHNNQTVITQTQSPCEILDHKVVNGRYWWQVRAKAMRKIQSGTLPSNNPVTITLQIVRVGWAESGVGELVAIDRWEE